MLFILWRLHYGEDESAIFSGELAYGLSGYDAIHIC
jgi:hypothetical protein